MKKLRLHGIKPSDGIAIRWLGAYGHASDIVEMARWEHNPTRQIACEVIPHGKPSRIKHPSVGLLVDQHNTSFIRGYAGDSYTEVTGSKLVQTRKLPYVTDWGSSFGLYKLAQKNNGGNYIEATIEYPEYLAVVVRNTTESTLRIANTVSSVMGIPVWILDESNGCAVMQK